MSNPTPNTAMILKTPLHAAHVDLKARMVPFAGYDMPVQYTSVIEEHKAVRDACGIFDVSHMGLATIEGSEVRNFLQFALTRDISKTLPSTAAYSLLCHEHGGTVDDLIIYCEREDLFWLVLNASNKEKDFSYLKKIAATHPQFSSLKFTTHFSDYSLIALQGPNSTEVLQALGWKGPFPKAFSFAPNATIAGLQTKIAFTGYTGEIGCEIFVKSADANHLWKSLLQDGQKFGLKPCGLAARDTLRTEMGYSLYGHELNDDINPVEAGLNWAVGFGKENFVGKAALVAAKANPKRKIIALKNASKQAPRPEMPVYDSTKKQVGIVTSGTFAPSLGYAIGLALVDNNSQAPYTVDIRGNQVAFELTQRPFYKKTEQSK